MRHIIRLSNIGSVIFSVLFMISCNSNDDDSTVLTPGITIEEGKLKDFPLFGIQYKEINIVDPEIVENQEVKYGDIKITVSSTTSLDNISASITSAELNLSKFSISPGNEIGLSYDDQKINVYTITNATGDKEELLHYNVSIVKEVEPVPETLKITNFTFEKSKNPSLPNDIMISRTIEDTGRDIIYLFVPLGTDFTSLIPTITYDGTKLFYTQDSSVAPVDMDAEYPEGNASIDFKYPKNFILAVKDKNNDKLRTTKVIVDVINPLKIETVSITTPDATEGNSETFTVTKWINQGNHILEYEKATTYENQEPITPTKVITARRILPSGGLIPGENRDVLVTVNSRDYPEGTYKTTAVFYPSIKYNKGIDDLLEPVKLSITSRIVK
ncbi:hypothetical protein IWQ47_005120 [Aquimarina sp. EL_43]|uniref:hypothetical protein n=1 Tax=unclassified Aquimarina TaxID=2627091 RepID=UPI0018CA64E5|nr:MULTISPECIES: hypothetical protein [unclassified Aquimarina]MBG6133648.1 hypothetical protein [Aquimarina sp. EL_35]MBG6152417.1 hypothetical protein [Aquimarina sp. EL_32]MBG6172021.1 hypothetical protein [Aquimarina sp. EL_43]